MRFGAAPTGRMLHRVCCALLRPVRAVLVPVRVRCCGGAHTAGCCRPNRPAPPGRTGEPYPAVSARGGRIGHLYPAEPARGGRIGQPRMVESAMNGRIGVYLKPVRG